MCSGSWTEHTTHSRSVNLAMPAKRMPVRRVTSCRMLVVSSISAMAARSSALSNEWAAVTLGTMFGHSKGVAAGAATHGQVSVDSRMLLHQALALGFQSGNFGVDVFDLLLDIVMVLLQYFLGFCHIGRCRRGAAQRLVRGFLHGQAGNQADHRKHH